MKLKIIIISIITISFLFSIWITFFTNYPGDEEIAEWHEIKFKKYINYEKAENYEIYESKKGKIIRNSHIDLTFLAPKEWKIEISEFENGAEISLLSPNLKNDNGFLKKGCEIKSGSVYFVKSNGQKTKYDLILEKIEKGSIEKNQEIISINDRSFLKTLKYENSHTGGVISIEKPLNNGLHFWNIYFSNHDREKCLKEFSDLLDSIIFKSI